MYDPEFNIWMENLTNEIRTSTENIKNIVGENHPLVNLCECLASNLEIIDQMRNDYDNCFDEMKRKIMLKDIRKAFDDLISNWKQVAKIYENK